MRWFLTIVGLGLALAVPGVAWADLAPVDQPPFAARDTVIVSPSRLYVDPALPPGARGLRTLSMPTVLREVTTRLDADPRVRVLRDGDERLIAAARSERQQDLAFIAQRSAALGIDHFLSFNLATAAAELESALEGFERTMQAWVEPRVVAEAWQYLALTHLALAREDDVQAAEHEARAVAAFRSMIRVAPQRTMSADAYPRSVLDAYERAFAAHVLDDALLLRTTDAEARTLAGQLGVTQLVFVFSLTDAAGTRLFLQVWDGVADRFVHDDVLSIEPTDEAATEALLSSLSRFLACQELVPPPDYEEPDLEAGSVYLHLGYSSGTFLGTVTRRPFWMHGASVSASVLLRNSIGLYAEGAQWAARRDRDGDLVGSLDVTRLSLGAESNARWGRGRMYIRGGADLTRVGALRATTSFWCKVSEGEPAVFDELRECEEADVVDNPAQVQLGARFALGGALRIGGPVWLYGAAHLTLYVTPFDERALDTPFGVDVGLGYRF